MKIEQLFVQHLYQNKQTALEGIGLFKLKADVRLPSENDKEGLIAPDAFSFEYNLKAQEDDTLVDYIVQQTGKIKPLAKSDLESYSMLAKQFLNLGKPLVIDGVGTLQINQKGEYEFTGGQFINPKIDDIFQQVKERKEDEVSFESENPGSKKRNNLVIGLTIAGILVVGLLLYYFLIYNNTPQKNNTETALVNDTTLKAARAVDSVKINTSVDSGAKAGVDTNKLSKTLASNPALPLNNSGTFKIVLKEYSTQAKIQKSYDRLREWGHKVIIVRIDSTNYKLALSFVRPLTDTVKVRDSVKRFFGGNPYVLLDK